MFKATITPAPRPAFSPDDKVTLEMPYSAARVLFKILNNVGGVDSAPPRKAAEGIRRSLEAAGVVPAFAEYNPNFGAITLPGGEIR